MRELLFLAGGIILFALVIAALKHVTTPHHEKKKKEWDREVEKHSKARVIGMKKRGEIEEKEGDEESEDDSKEESSDGDKLTDRAKKLNERYSKIKDRKRGEIEEREKQMHTKMVKDLLKEERRKREKEKEKQLEKKPEPSELTRLDDQRRRIKQLIELTEARYQGGSMTQENFHKIIGDYQKQLVELDDRIAGLKKN